MLSISEKGCPKCTLVDFKQSIEKHLRVVEDNITKISVHHSVMS